MRNEIVKHLKYKDVKLVDVQAFDDLVAETYGRVYSFQQQNDCRERGSYEFSVPVKYPEDYENDTIPEVVNGSIMGVSFNAWLSRDPHQKLDTTDDWDRNFGIDLFWRRNFYPCIDMLINDMYIKGLIEKGNYLLNIDW